MTAQERLDKYLAMREEAQKAFMSDPSLLSVCVQTIGQLEADIRECRKELGLSEWGYT